MTRRKSWTDDATRPTADHYARALLAAAALMGEREQLVQMALDPLLGERSLKRTAMKARPVAYQALKVRFPHVQADAIARALGMGTSSPKGAQRYSQLATIVAGRI